MRELPGSTGMQIILCKNHAVDEKDLSAEVEQVIEREMGVKMHIQVCTPGSDPRAEEPVIDLSGMIDMEIDIDQS